MIESFSNFSFSISIASKFRVLSIVRYDPNGCIEVEKTTMEPICNFHTVSIFPFIILEALKFFLGLKYIHSKGIVHHDVKPGNILIQLQNNEILAQLGDFGLACPQQSDGHGEGFGTKPYAAPEQLNGRCTTKVTSAKFIYF